MNTLFPLATETELAEGDNTCIICREEMTVESGAKKLPCNHIFHPNCLRSWFQRQQTCPTCRNGVLIQRRPNIIPGAAAPQAQQPPAGANILPGFNANIFFGGNAQNRPMMAFGPVQMAANQPQQGQQQQAPPLQPHQHPQHGHQQAPPPAFHPNFMNAFNPMFGMPPPMMAPPPPFPQPPVYAAQPQQMPQQLQQVPGGQQQQPSATAPPTQAQGQAPSGAASQAGTSTSTNAQQPSMPSFYMPGMFPSFQSPFPFPQPPTFAALSDVEIAQMEGRERANIEARIHVLRNISVLLDAAVLQLQQYMSIAPQIHTAVPTSSQSGGNANGPSTADANAQSTSQPQNAPNTESVPDVELKPSTSKSPEPESSSDELRRRRLAKFEASQSTNTTTRANEGTTD